MLKILQARLQQFMNLQTVWELPQVQAALRKGRGTSDQVANICQITEKARESQKSIYFCFTDYIKALTVCSQQTGTFLKERGIPDHLTCLLRNPYASQEVTVPDMEQWAGSKLGKEYIKAIYCHLAYLTYMQSVSCKMPG